MSGSSSTIQPIYEGGAGVESRQNLCSSQQDLNFTEQSWCKGSRIFWVCKDPAPSEETILGAKNEKGHRHLHGQLPYVCFNEMNAWEVSWVTAPVANLMNPWEAISMNFMVDLSEIVGNTVIWTIMDLFSKQVHFVVCTKIYSTQTLAKLFIQHIY